MNYLGDVRRSLVDNLWAIYQSAVPQAARIGNHLLSHFVEKLPQDHFAIVDLPGEQGGIGHLKKIFEVLGFSEMGRDYLPEKQNDFLWLAEDETLEARIEDALCQVVVADFRLSELPRPIRVILEKYTHSVKGNPIEKIELLAEKAKAGDFEASKVLTEFLSGYLSGRNWPLPTVEDFEAVKQVNELLAWVLVFGRMPNHFTFQIHRVPPFQSLSEFNQYLMQALDIKLNDVPCLIKGSPEVGLEQSSTLGEIIDVKLANGTSSLANCFVEFIWRYPIKKGLKPMYWKDCFNGFIATNANHVVESLYIGERV